MTPQEAQMLQDLVRKVEGTALTEKDPDAEALLQDGLGRDPDAIYKLAQTVLIQNIALEQARTQMERMQRQLSPPQQQPAHSTSFLGGLLHHHAPQAAPPPPPPASQYQGVPPSYGAPGYAPMPGYAPPPSYGGSGGGFLRSAATTAAGVAGGMLAFEGIESLMHGGMASGYGFGGGIPVDETVINNYYEGPQDQGATQGQDDPGQYTDGSADLSGDQGFGDEQNYGDPGGDDMGADMGSDDGGDYV